MENLNFVIAKKLSELRKQKKMTQLELAEQLNYSDKAVSKWEQGESLPGIEVLYKLSKLYGVSLDYLVGEETVKPSRSNQSNLQKRNRIITLLSVLAVWLVAVVFYTSFHLSNHQHLWILFCWAVPASLTVATVFDIIWHARRFFFLMISLLMWSVLVCFCIQFLQYNIWIILGIGVPLQIAAVLWARLVK